MTGDDVVRAAIPGASESLCSHIIWGRTPFPFAVVTARDLYRAARRWQRAAHAGRQLCDLCDRIADDGFTCETCRKALSADRTQGGDCG